ncbi:MAG: VWA domain-containing protein [Candidatus Oxydemutatoraceae bacterium WSBS_2016_MAG_OTU14]
MMSALSNFHFLRPEWFWALLPSAALLWYLWHSRFGRSAWHKFCDPLVLPFILQETNNTSNRIKLSLIALSGLLAITALAGPVWERIAQPTLRDDSALVILLDLSASMNAVDLKPSRIARARYKINDFIDRYPQGQVALMVYSDQAFPVVPLTKSREPIKKFLQAIETNLMPNPGSIPAKALQAVSDVIKRNQLERGNILLVTDFADDAAIEMAQKMAQENFSISVLGVGTEQGAPIILPSGTILKDKEEVVISKLESNLLSQLANAGRGVYRQIEPQHNRDVDALIAWANKRATERTDLVEADKRSDVWREEGPWLLLLLLPLVLPAFRKGLLVFVVCLIPFAPQSSYAWEWKDLWSRPDQQGMSLLKKGQAEAAGKQFENLEWKGVAQYRDGHFKEAAETFEGLSGVQHLYNLGNAKAHAGDLLGALKAYNEVLEIEPGMEDAIHNRDIVKKMIEEQATQSEESEEGDGEKGDEENKTEGQKSEEQKEQGEEDQENTASEEGEPNEEEQDEQKTAGKEGEENEGEEEQAAQEPMSEEEQALEQALQRIQDDSKGLLRRKFRYQHQKNGQQRRGGAW